MKFNLDFPTSFEDEPEVDSTGTVMSDIAWNTAISILVVCISLVPAGQAILQQIEIALATSSESAPLDPDIEPVRVTIDAEGQVQLQERSLGAAGDAAAALPDALKQAIDHDNPVWVIPDRSVDWQVIVPITEAIHTVTHKVAFVTEQQHEVSE